MRCRKGVAVNWSRTKQKHQVTGRLSTIQDLHSGFMELLKEAWLNFVTLKCVLVFVETKQASKKDHEEWDNKSYTNAR